MTFAVPVDYTRIDQQMRQEQDAQVRPVVRHLCAIGVLPAYICREWHVPFRHAETPNGYETALHGVVSADDGANVYDAARNQVVRFMGDVNQWPCAHGAVVVNTPGVPNFTLMHYAYGCGLQAVQNRSDGVYWYGGALATDNVIYNYGQRISTQGAACVFGCVVGVEVAEFDAKTLQLKALVPVTGPAKYLSISDAVAWRGGHWLIGTAGTSVKTGKAIWIPNGDEADPAGWRLYSTLPSSLNLGTVVSPYYSGTAWYAITKRSDLMGSYLEELTAKCMAGCTWRVTGATWATFGSVSYSAQIDSDPAPAGKLLVTYAENDKAWYGLHWLYIPKR